MNLPPVRADPLPVLIVIEFRNFPLLVSVPPAVRPALT